MVRLAKPGDLPRILELYAIARAYMAHSGNPNQWPETYPNQELLEEDMERESLYVIERGGVVCGVFVLALGEDAGYAEIRGGAWLREGPYGTIHRLASDGRTHGVLDGGRIADRCGTRPRPIREQGIQRIGQAAGVAAVHG